MSVSGASLSDIINLSIIDGWKSRKSAVLWGSSIRQALHDLHAKSASKKYEDIAEDCSTILTEILLSHAFGVGKAPSSLLLSYLRYALTTNLIDSLHFCNVTSSLKDKNPITPSKTSHFKSFIELIASLIPQIARCSKQTQYQPLKVNGEESNGPTVNSPRVRLESEISKTLMQLLLFLLTAVKFYKDQLVSFGSEEGKGVGIPKSGVSMNGHALSNGVLQKDDPLVQSNMQDLLKLLVKIFTKKKTICYIITAKLTLQELWKTFEDMVQEQSLTQWHILVNSPFKRCWVELKNSIDVLTGSAFKTKHIVKSFNQQCRVLDLSVENQSKPWIPLPFAIEEELTGKRIRTIEESASHFNVLRRAKCQSYRALYAEMWISTWRSFHNCEPNTRQCNIRRNYLFAKIPLMLAVLKQWSKETPPLTELNDVELSLLDFEHYSPISQTPALENIVKVLIQTGLVSSDKIKMLFPLLDQSLFNPSGDNFNLSTLSQGATPKTLKDVEFLYNMSKDSRSLDVLAPVIACVCSSILNEWGIQHLLIQYLMMLIDPNTHMPSEVVAYTLSQLWNQIVLVDIINMHGKLQNFVSFVAQHMDNWGNSKSQSGDAKLYSYFSTAFFLLIFIFEYYEIRYTDNFDILHHSNLSKLSLSNPFIEWYYEYVNNINSISTSSSVDVYNVGEQILKILFASPSNQSQQTKDETFKKNLSSFTPWQTIQSLHYVLEQSFLFYRTLSKATGSLPSPTNAKETIASIINHVPCAQYCIISWLCHQLETLTYSQESENPDGSLFQLDVLLKLIESGQEQVLSLLNVELIGILQLYQPLKPKYSAAIEQLMPLPKFKTASLAAGGSGVTGSVRYDSSYLVTVIHRYFFSLIKEGTLPVELAMLHFRALLKCAGTQKFCALLVKEVMSTIPEKNLDLSNVHSTRSAELGGCILAACGIGTVNELLAQIPTFTPYMTSFAQGQVLAILVFHAIIYSALHTVKLDKSQSQGKLNGTVNGLNFLFSFLRELVCNFSVHPSAVMSFPVTFFSLVERIPDCTLRTLAPCDAEFINALYRIAAFQQLSLVNMANK